MSFGGRTLSALGKIGIVVSVIIVFLFGLVGTVYLSLRTSEVKVPDLKGKDRYAAEKMLEDAGLKIRVRGMKPTADKPDTILNQLPEAGHDVDHAFREADFRHQLGDAQGRQRGQLGRLEDDAITRRKGRGRARSVPAASSWDAACSRRKRGDSG